MTDFVFCDTETTGLLADDDIWEFAGIRRTGDGTETVLHVQICHDRVKAARLPEKFAADLAARFNHSTALHQHAAAGQIARFFAPTQAGYRVHLVGSNPAFDAAMLARLFRRAGIAEPPWHYHLIDVPAVAYGRLTGAGRDVPLPWSSDDLAAACGLTDHQHTRHTALGDTEWVRDWWDLLNPPRTSPELVTS